MPEDVGPAEETPADAMTAQGIVERVRAALNSADLEEMAGLLSPDVHWGAPDDPNPPCQNRGQVLRWYARGREAGTRATVVDAEVHGDQILVSLAVRSPDGGDAFDRWQILTVGPAGVTDIRGFDDRADAAARVAR
jgi:hypothetical protein